MTWLVTGGAGYIGSHVVRAMEAAGIKVVALDNLSSGHHKFLPPTVPMGYVSITDQEDVFDVIEENEITGVIHLAGYKYAGESVKRPLHTYEQNVWGTAALLGAMEKAGVNRLVFSSSAAVYGTPPTDIVTEDTPVAPESPYGESKLAGEWLIRAQERATAGSDAPLRATSLRYFNVVGSGTPEIYDASPHNLFPLVLKALAEGRAPRINGTDYNTPDGTCVRDYVHVADVAAAHVVAAQRLEAGESLEKAYNLGSGAGTSVKEIVDTCIEVTGADVVAEIGPRRAGDPDRIVASGELAARDLGWQMRHSLHDMVQSAWDAAPKA